MENSKPSVADILVALNGILNMHERAEKAGVPCQLNGEKRKFDMGQSCDCGTASCLMGSAALHPWFKEYSIDFGRKDFGDNAELHRDFDAMVMGPESYGLSYISDLSKLTIPQVRERLHAIILKHCGKDVLERANQLKKRGDKLKLGIPR